MTKAEKDKKIQSKYKLNGVVPSPPDDRDYTPETVCLKSVFLPICYRLKATPVVLNQGVYGSCVAHALSAALYYGESQSNLSMHNFSRGFIYGNRVDTDYQGEGMVIREALYHLNHEGDCLHKNFPYNNTYPWCKNQIKKNEKGLKAKAAPYKISNYFKLTRVADIKQALINCGSVICAIPIYSQFGANTPMPKKNEESQGMHAVCLVGWDDKGWIIQNSYGTLWGNKGFFHIPYEYPVAEWWGITVNGSPESNKAYVKLWVTLTNIINKIKSICN